MNEHVGGKMRGKGAGEPREQKKVKSSSLLAVSIETHEPDTKSGASHFCNTPLDGLNKKNVGNMLLLKNTRRRRYRLGSCPSLRGAPLGRLRASLALPHLLSVKLLEAVEDNFLVGVRQKRS